MRTCEANLTGFWVTLRDPKLAVSYPILSNSRKEDSLPRRTSRGVEACMRPVRPDKLAGHLFIHRRFLMGHVAIMVSEDSTQRN